MEKQTQPKEKKQHMANPTDGATTRIIKKKKKKKPNVWSADSSSKAKTEIRKGET